MDGNRMADRIARLLLIAFAVGVLGCAAVDAVASADDTTSDTRSCLPEEGCVPDEPGFWLGG